MMASHALDPSLALIRRVRRRRNVDALQRATYGAVAIGTTAVAVLVLLALAASVEVVTMGLAMVAVGLVSTTWMLVSHTRRRWLGRARAIAWVDATAGLEHRLVTLVSRHDHASALVPLLAAESAEGLQAWTLDRLMPERVPWGHLAAAGVGTYALALVLLTAPQWRPAAPPPVSADGAVATAADPQLARLPQRRLATTGTPRGGGAPASDASGASSGETGPAKPPRSAFPRLASALQRALRARLWGAEWARVAATDEAAPPSDATTSEAREHARSTRPGAPGRSVDQDLRRADAGERVPGASGTRAGAGTDPNLYGTRTDDDATAPGRFPIGLAALVRGRHGDPGPPKGEAPPAEPDAHPELASVPRAPTPFPRTSVPPEWEAVVRSVFAHREGDPP
jgi:hypothetical protein